jgi:hypothetical protein
VVSGGWRRYIHGYVIVSSRYEQDPCLQEGRRKLCACGPPTVRALASQTTVVLAPLALSLGWTPRHGPLQTDSQTSSLSHASLHFSTCRLASGHGCLYQQSLCVQQ